MLAGTCSGVTFRAPRAPMTTASSASWCTLVLPGGMRMASPGPITDVDGFRKSRGSFGASPVIARISSMCAA
jgi:hypothetical protein